MVCFTEWGQKKGQKKGQEPFWLNRQFGSGILLVFRRPSDAKTTTRRCCR